MDVDIFNNSLLICNFDNYSKLEDGGFDNKNELSYLWNSDWLKLINSEPVIHYFKNKFENSLKIPEYDILIASQAFLFAFVQENFTGSSLSNEYFTFLENNWPSDVNAVELLKVDTEELNPNVRFPEFLLAAKLLLNHVDKNNSKLIVSWWKIRLIFIHQCVLEELASSIYEEFCSLSNYVMEHISQINNIELEALLLIEIAQFYITINRIHKAEKILKEIYEKLGIELNIEGLLGYRTKFQQKPIAQLCLKVNQGIKQFLSSKETSGTIKLPTLLKLDDEVRLEVVKFVSEEDNDVLEIPSIIQTLLLVHIKFLLKSQPKDRLADEILEPYIRTLLLQEYGPLSVRLGTLFLNIKQEAHHKRTVERCLKQCEELLKTINGSKYDIQKRLSYGFSPLIPKWEIQKQLGDLLISLGLVKTALDVYLEIQSWENVIKCYTMLDLRHKASEVIKNELQKKETVKLYCLLGDTEDDPQYYEMAWKLSNETSGRAQRHWGLYYFSKKEYDKAIQHFQKSLTINSLQEVIWLRLGYSALMTEKWDTAVQAYLRYTHIEPNSFESWNNLAKALIKLGDKKRAHKVLNEALKCNFDNYMVWENFMVVSIDTGNFEDVINAYNRLIELKVNEKFLDLEILELLVNAIVKNIPDANDRPSIRLQKKLNELLAHQCVQHANEPKLWEFASYLAETSLSRAQKLLKSYSVHTQKNTSWSKSRESCLKVMNLCKDLCESSLKALENYSESEKLIVKSQLSSARLSTQGCVRNVENNSEHSDDINLLLEDLKMYVQKATEELKKIS